MHADAELHGEGPGERQGHRVGREARARPYQCFELEHRDGKEVAATVYTPNTATGYLRTIVGRSGFVSHARFARELYGAHCNDPRHSRDWFAWRIKPNAQSAWEIGEAAYRAGVEHASGLLMLLAASRLVDFAATIIGLDADVIEHHSTQLEALLQSSLAAVRHILLDNTPIRNVVSLGGDVDISALLRNPEFEPIWRRVPYIDLEREIGNYRKRAAARSLWKMHADIRGAASESFTRWRLKRSQPAIDQRRAACAVAIAAETRMLSRDREEMVVEALLGWLRERTPRNVAPATKKTLVYRPITSLQLCEP